MEQKKSIQIPEEIHEYLWLRYLPETTYKRYLLIGYLQAENIRGQNATDTLFGANLPIENNDARIIEEKRRIIEELGLKYPENSMEDIELLLKYQLIKIGKDPQEQVVYLYNIPVPKPQEVLSLNSSEIQVLENIRFEMQHQNALNMILTLLLNSHGNLMATLDHIYKTTKVKLTDIKLVLDYLIEEGSITVKANKPVDQLKKEDKIYISINKGVFEEKRFVIE